MVFVEIYERLVELIFAPINYRDMMWILFPLVLTLILMELYFDRYKREELGWNTAFGNSLVLIFVSLDIIKYLYVHNMLEYVMLENALAIAVIMLGLALTVMSFFHVLPKEVAFGLSSRLPINIIAYLTVVVIYAGIPIDVITGVAAVIFAILVGLLLKFLSWLIPESGEIPELENIEKDIE